MPLIADTVSMYDSNSISTLSNCICWAEFLIEIVPVITSAGWYIFVARSNSTTRVGCAGPAAAAAYTMIIN